jgi:hypothetical protein
VANTVPTKPTIPISCPVPEVVEDGYYTDAQSHTNVARKDSFLLVLDLPCTLKPLLLKENRFCHGGSLDRLQFSVWGWVVPEVSVPSQEKPYGGQVFKHSSNARNAYEAININFTVDNRYDNYYILWKWLNLMNDTETSSSHSMNDYMTTISVFALDERKEPVAEWVYHNAFITSLGGLNPSMRDTGELESTFTFDFSQLEMKLV